MRCKLCGKVNNTATKNRAHSWVHSQHCARCHYLGMRMAYYGKYWWGKKDGV